LTPKIVSTTRFGYFFENYHSFGWQTQTPDLFWAAAGFGACDNSTVTGVAGCPTGASPLPANLALQGGTQTAPFTPTFTPVNANKHSQFDQDIAFFTSGWGGTHNVMCGYQLNHLSNVISQNGNVPFAYMWPGRGANYSTSTGLGGQNCGGPGVAGTLINEWGICAGQYGYVTELDFATVLTKPAVDWNHAFFVQDAWTIGHGLTINAGILIEKESLPVPSGLIPSGFSVPQSINFSWSDKIEPRLGAAWGSRNGKMKIFGSYGVTNDIMKLLLAQTSWGGQGYNICAYPLGPDGTPAGFNISDLNFVFKNGRGCPSGPTNLGSNFGGTGA